MSRRRKTSGADAVTDLVAKLPWLVGVVLAVMAYVGLHRLAAPVAVTPLQPGQAGVQVVIQSMPSVGQYLVPVFCLIGAGLSAYRQRERRGLVDRVTQNPAAGMLNGMSWRQFEKLVGESFRLQGYAVKETGGGGADGGVDLRLTRNGETYLVRCKQWRALKVGVDVVRELYGVMAAEGAAGGFVVTSGRFTEEAAKFAAGRNLTLLDGIRVKGLIQQATTTQSTAPARFSPATVENLSCPICATAMVRRTAKRGANSGADFLVAPDTHNAKWLYRLSVISNSITTNF